MFDIYIWMWRYAWDLEMREYYCDDYEDKRMLMLLLLLLSCLIVEWTC